MEILEAHEANWKIWVTTLKFVKKKLSLYLVIIDLYSILVLILTWQHLSAVCLLHRFPLQTPHLPEVVLAATRDVGDAAKQQVWRMAYFPDGTLEP